MFVIVIFFMTPLLLESRALLIKGDCKFLQLEW